MKRTTAAALALCIAFRAQAEDAPVGPPPPPPPPDDAQVSQPPDDAQLRPLPIGPPVGTANQGYLEGCFGPSRSGIAPVQIYGGGPIPLGGQPSATLPAFSGLKDDKAWLVVAVLAVAVLPVVIYAMDKPAPRAVLRRFRCPTMSLDILGGADNSHAAFGNGSYGFVSTRLTLGAEHIGADLQFDPAPSAVRAFSAHLLLRPTPRDHVEGGLAIGYRRSVLGNRMEEGLEVGLPHRYALWRDEEDLQTLALEVRPLFLLGSRFEPSLEAAFVFPLADVVNARVGGRVYTFGGDLLWGLSAGLGLTL